MSLDITSRCRVFGPAKERTSYPTGSAFGGEQSLQRLGRARHLTSLQMRDQGALQRLCGKSGRGDGATDQSRKEQGG